MFEKKILSEITEEELNDFFATRGKHQEPNDRLSENGDFMDVLVAGAKRLSEMSTEEKGDDL